MGWSADIWDRLLVAYTGGRLPPFIARRVEARLAVDAELAATYDALCRLELAAARRPPTDDAPAAPAAPAALTTSQRERLAQAVLDGVDRRGSVAHAGASAPGRILRAAPLAFAVAAGALFVVVGDPASSDLTARSGGGGSVGVGVGSGGGGHEPLGVRASCLSADGTRLVGSATVGASRSADRLTCPTGSLLAFATTNMGQAPRHLFIVGVTRSGERRWYEPFGTAASVPVPPGTVDDVLSPLADTQGMPAEPVTLHVLITDAPLSARDVERELAAALDRGMAVGRAERLPLDVPLQARIELTP